ncbi:MAG: hypothetical protein IT306_21665 [Chloroflexi bacterium]|nr:hypothetical protein [Chloroflexota bacterium]
MPNESIPPPARSQLPFRIAFFLVASIVLGLIVALPFAIRSLTDDLFNSVESNVYPFQGLTATAARGQIHISIVDLDEARLRATLRLSGHRNCPGQCPPGNRVVLFSLWSTDGDAAGSPPSAKVDMTNASSVVSDDLTLPVHGHPTLYPFDTYELWLGVGVAALLPDGSVRPITRDESAGMLRATIQEQLPRESMGAPQPLSLTDIDDPSQPYQLVGAERLVFTRPIHERVLAVLLVLLVAAAACYAVFMRPLHDLVINSGGLVLGVWGIRALLSPGTASRTLVDLSLSLVILFLLSAITFRALQFLWGRGGFSWRRPAPPVTAEAAPAAPAADAAPARPDAPPARLDAPPARPDAPPARPDAPTETPKPGERAA